MLFNFKDNSQFRHPNNTKLIIFKDMLSGIYFIYIWKKIGPNMDRALNVSVDVFGFTRIIHMMLNLG